MFSIFHHVLGFLNRLAFMDPASRMREVLLEMEVSTMTDLGRLLKILATTALVSCSGSDDSLSSKVVGAWVLENWSDALVLSDDGSATATQESNGRPSSVTGTGTWSTKGNTLTIVVLDGFFEITFVEWQAGSTIEATYSTAGNALTLTIDDSRLRDATHVFTRVE